MNNNWTEIIYDVYDFLYWEPQHIWKIKNKNSKINSVKKSINHIEKMEVSLNQILNIFFSFLPSELFTNLVEGVIKKPISKEKYTLYLKEVDNLIDWINFSTQPDFFFIWKEKNIFIEMKINSKSSLEQLMKYIYLHIKDCERENKEKKLVLIFLWNWEFKNLWKEKYENIDKLKEEFSCYEVADETKKWKVDLRKYKDKIKHLANDMNIWFFNYTDFNNFCLKNIKENKNDEILVKLLSGLVEEINKRKLK